MASTRKINPGRTLKPREPAKASGRSGEVKRISLATFLSYVEAMLMSNAKVLERLEELGQLVKLKEHIAVLEGRLRSAHRRIAELERPEVMR